MGPVRWDRSCDVVVIELAESWRCCMQMVLSLIQGEANIQMSLGHYIMGGPLFDNGETRETCVTV